MVFKGKKPIMFTNGRAEATYLLETYSQRLLETVALSVIIALRSASARLLVLLGGHSPQ